MLAYDKAKNVKLAVIKNPNTPIETLKMLAYDEERRCKNSYC